MAEDETKEQQPSQDQQVAATATEPDGQASPLDEEAADQTDATDHAGAGDQEEAGQPAEDTADQMDVEPAQLPELRATPGSDTAEGRTGNIDMVLDVSVPITVELGRTRMLIRDVLKLGVGGVVELDKIAGEPVDLFVRDLKFATGEVVVVGDRFGVRIKEVVDPRAAGKETE